MFYFVCFFCFAVLIILMLVVIGQEQYSGIHILYLKLLVTLICIMFLLLQIYLTVFSFHLFVNFQRKEEYQTGKLLFKWSAVHFPIM